MKKILFAAPSHYDLYKSIIKNFEYLGYEVTPFVLDGDFKYLNKKDKIVNFFRKTFLGDKNYKKITLYYKYKTFQTFEMVNELSTQKFDYAFFIRPDMFPIEAVEKLTKLAKLNVCYQWDGLDRYPEIYKYQNLFQRFFVFDKNDLSKNKSTFLPLTNFSFDYDKEFIPSTACSSDVFFIGTYLDSRMKKVITFAKKASELGQNLNLMIFSHKNKIPSKHKLPNLNYIENFISYEESMVHLKNAKMVLDFKTDAHNGLSFRTFEALYYEKKLITNNPLVKDYDFYNPQNIFYWDGVNLEGYEDFIIKPYLPIEEKIKEKYGFSNWAKYIFNIDPHQPIKLY